MGTLTQTILPFKVEATGGMLTAKAGLALFGEFTHGLGLRRWIGQEMPKPGSGRGYKAGAFVSPLVLMLAGGGRSLEDMRTLKADAALAPLLKPDILPSTDAFGGWLRRAGAGAGLDGPDRINRRIVATTSKPSLDGCSLAENSRCPRSLPRCASWCICALACSKPDRSKARDNYAKIA